MLHLKDPQNHLFIISSFTGNKYTKELFTRIGCVHNVIYLVTLQDYPTILVNKTSKQVRQKNKMTERIIPKSLLQYHDIDT